MINKRYEKINSLIKSEIIEIGNTIDKKKWIYFSDEAFPELKDIKLENLSDEKCP